MTGNLAVIGFFLVLFHASLASPKFDGWNERPFIVVGLLGALVAIGLTLAGVAFG